MLLREAQRLLLASAELRVLHAAPTSRRSLVFVQCSHGYSAASLLVSGRQYDIWLNFYDGSGAASGAAAKAEVVTSQRGTKTTALFVIIRDLPNLMLRYDQLLLLDDDIEFVGNDIDRLFCLAREAGLAICQASLTPDSYAAWPDLVQPAVGARTRRVNAVEIMMPLLSRFVMEKGAWAFGRSISGYGADLLLCSYMARTFGIGSFVIGDVVAAHRRPIDQEKGDFYRFLKGNGIDAHEELNGLALEFGLDPISIQIIG